VELVRRAVEAFNRQDLTELAGLSDADLEFVSVLTAVDETAAIHRGPGTWTNYFEAMNRAWREWYVDDFRVFDAGGDDVAAVFRLVGRGRQSGVPVERPIGITYRIRHGKLWRMRSYLDPAEALATVGLEE
jgi:ketosteroid isomerase-like protein